MNIQSTTAYFADISPLSDASLFSRVYESVSSERKAKTDRMRFMKDKILSLGAEYLLMCACRDFGIDYRDERIVTGECSKPFFTFSPYFFNLSHSGERAMCIMSRFPAGCDVEKVATPDIKIAERFFAADEYDLINSCSTPKEQNAMFFRIWTLKESFVKCTGQGFHLPPDSFSIQLADGIKVRQTYDGGEYSFFENHFDDGYRYACCIRAGSRGAGTDTVQWKHIIIE